jgi:ankyrin repeat protein
MLTAKRPKSATKSPSQSKTKTAKTKATQTFTQESFNAAASDGNLKAVQLALRSHPKFAEDPQALCDAAYHGHKDVVARLLHGGADANALLPSPQHYRPLHRVVEFHKTAPKLPEHEEIVQLLLENGADVYRRATALQLTPLALAAIGGQTQFIPLLLPYLEGWDLFTAAVLGEVRQVTTFISRDPRCVLAADVNGMTALHYAAASRIGGQSEKAVANLRRVAELLIEHGADLNGYVEHGPHGPATPTAFAAGNPAVLQLLLLQGTDPTDALAPALWDGDVAIADAMVRAGADLQSMRAANWVAQFTQRGYYPQAQWLIERGADPTGRTDGRTALHWAIQRGASIDFVRFLLDHHSDTKATTPDGLNALELAESCKKAKLATLIERHAA